jgi:hypothetical protein
MANAGSVERRIFAVLRQPCPAFVITPVACSALENTNGELAFNANALQETPVPKTCRLSIFFQADKKQKCNIKVFSSMLL